MLTQSLPDLFRKAADHAGDGKWVCLPAKVLAFDPIKSTVDVALVLKPSLAEVDGEPLAFEELPNLPNVPIQWPRGGGMFLRFPLVKGDHVLLVFCDLAPGEWRATGEVSEATDTRRNSLSFAYAIPGISPDASVVADYVAGKMVMGVDGDQAQVHFAAGEICLGKTHGDFVALASKVDAALAAIKGHVHSGVTAGAAASGTSASLSGIDAPTGSALVKCQ